MRYKNQGDIDYKRFSDFIQIIEDIEPSEIPDEVMRIFYPDEVFNLDLVSQFLKALETPGGKFPYKIDLDFKTADKFIDADTFATSNRKLELAEFLIVKKWRFQKIVLSLANVNHVFSSFIDYASNIKNRYPWIYNPPFIPIPGGQQNSLKSEYMKDFVSDYGGYIEIIYILCNGDWTKKDEVEEWPLHKFLFLGEYMLRKRKIESI